MSGQSYWGQGPQYGVIHKQDFTADGSGSQLLILKYTTRDTAELLVCVDGQVMQPGVDFVLDRDPGSFIVKRITIKSARTGSSEIRWLETLRTNPGWAKSQVTDQTPLSAQPDNDDAMALSDYDGGDVCNKVTYGNFISGINPPVSGDVGGTVLATVIQPDVVTYDKMQDVVTAGRVLGATTSGTVAEIQVPLEAFADDAVDSTKLKDVNDLIVYDAAGSVLFTMYGAGS
jgi:hypothetical protein